MNTLSIFQITVLALILGIVAWAILLTRKGFASRRDGHRKSKTTQARKQGLECALGMDNAGFSGVSVTAKTTQSPCSAARALKGKIFPPEAAPPLPLPECNERSQCECRYRYHGDRRREDRRVPSSFEPSYLAQNGMKDRRRTDEPRRNSKPRTPA